MANSIWSLLEQLQIHYERYEHEPVTSCAESTALLPDDLPGVRTKHLLLKDRKGKRHFLLMVDENKRVDLAGLANQLEVNRLSFASDPALSLYLGCEAGSLSLLSLVNDPQQNVELVIDKSIWQAEIWDAHPNESHIVLLIERADWMRYFEYLNRTPRVVAVPSL